MDEIAKHDEPAKASLADMVWVPGGEFLMGSDKHYPEEAPAHRVRGRRLLDGQIHGHQP